MAVRTEEKGDRPAATLLLLHAGAPIHSPSEQSLTGRSQTPETEAHSFAALHCLCIHSKFRLFPLLKHVQLGRQLRRSPGGGGRFGVAERRFILSGYRGTKSQKVATDAGAQASRKTVCTATGTCVCAAAQSAFARRVAP